MKFGRCKNCRKHAASCECPGGPDLGATIRPDTVKARQ